MRNQKGFSLVELMVVVIIVAIITAIAIPNLMTSRRAATEASAASSLRTILSAEHTYLSTLGSQTSFAALSVLSANALLDPSWTDGVSKNGYTFTLELGGGAGNNVHFCAYAAAPDILSKSFTGSDPGAIHYALATVTPPSCTAATGEITSGTVLGQ